MKVALVYDRVNKWGGAEKVLLALNELFPDAPLYTSVYNSKKAHWANVFPKVIPSFLQKLPFMQDKHEFLGMLTPVAFESFNFDEYDLVISVTSEAAKGIITKPTTRHVCICLTPTRYLWSHYDTYFKGGVFKDMARQTINYLRDWDKVAAQRPDKIVAISTEVQSRIKKYYGRESNIIFPPVDIDKFQKLRLTDTTSPQDDVISDYYLIVSRLVSYKRIDLAIEAFNKLGLPLVIVGTGFEENKLKSIAKANIVFKGFARDTEVIKLYKNAKALIFPGEEDFGIVMVESLASGTPVIAYKKGGAVDIVEDKKTGILFADQTVEGILEALEKFKKVKFIKKELVDSIQKFSKKRFDKEILDIVNV